jgi:hypothetical protein
MTDLSDNGIPLIDYQPLKKKRHRKEWVYKSEYDKVVNEVEFLKRALKWLFLVELLTSLLMIITE